MGLGYETTMPAHITHFLYQGSDSLRVHNLPQTAPLAKEQGFKSTSLGWGIFFTQNTSVVPDKAEGTVIKQVVTLKLTCLSLEGLCVSPVGGAT